jgi:NAD(P)-dependent dehydrogenase (short-subunit alcohol dehydrogenase family)
MSSTRWCARSRAWAGAPSPSGADVSSWIEVHAAVAQVHEVLGTIFLCSDDAAYITGEALNVSGGQTMV